jgi:hypothetical protein
MEAAPLAELADELLSMARTDQDMRTRAIKDISAWDGCIDHANTARLKEVVGEHGWPTISLVGPEASRAAWLLVQHAYADPDFMKQCLALMKAVGNDVAPANVAFLEDRLLVMDDEPQIYGTQFQRQGDDWVPFPIQEPDRVDELRASVGLGTLADNAERIRSIHSHP